MEAYRYSRLEGKERLKHGLSQLKRICADMVLENRALKDLHRKKALVPSCRREAVLFLIAAQAFDFSRLYRRRRIIGFHKFNLLNELIAKHPRWGFWKCFRALRRTHSWNHKKVYHVYCDLWLTHKRRAKKRRSKRG